MDILIKNLKMPIGERKVVLILKSDGEVSVYEDKRLVRFTEAVALSEHGDLKDYDSLGNKMANKMEKRKRTWHPFYYEGFKEALKMLDSAPTIVEATE